MKNLLRSAVIFFAVLCSTNLYSQNIMINVLSQNSGQVKKGFVSFFEVTIYNTNPIKALAMYKIRPQISFPLNLVDIPETGHILPEGWSINVNKNGVVTLSNGTDIIPENASRTVLIAMKGKNIGGPTPINGNLFFSNGTAPGLVSGIAPKEDNIADNSSTSTVTVL